MTATSGKIILHLDFNTYFASVEQQANPFLRGKPIGIAGKGRENLQGGFGRVTVNGLNPERFKRSVITTASRQAKRSGVKTAMATWEALKICPDLIIIPGDPRKYAQITKRFLQILQSNCDEVEQFSTDEAFADITTASGGDYFGATLLAERIRNQVRDDCGEVATVSIGVGPNKLVAKLASESVKPNGLTVITPEAVEEFVLGRSLADVCGIGPRLESRLGAMGVTSMATLKKVALPVLLREFKQYGLFLYQAVRGIGPDYLEDDQADPLSIGQSYTFPYNLTNELEVKTNLLALADRVAWRLRKQSFAAKKISVFVRWDSFSGWSGSRAIKDPIYDGRELTDVGWSMILPRLRSGTINTKPGAMSFELAVRQLGISVSDLIQLDTAEPLLKQDQKKKNALLALDKVSAKFGTGSWQRLSTLCTVFKERVSGWHYDHED